MTYRRLSAAVVLLAASAGTARAESDTFGLGSGRDGDVTIAGLNTPINDYASITATAAVGTRDLVVDSVTGFAAGQVVMLWQTTGLTAPAVGDQSTITLAATNVGHYELGRIEGIMGMTIRLTNPIANANGYRANTAQVIHVPEYQNLTITVGGSIAPRQAWNGSKGGVVAFLATGTVTNNGIIQADVAGFRGGVILNHGSLDNCNVALATLGTPNNGYQMKGEGFVPALYSAAPTGTTALGGRGNIANGGGGGVCHNSGGGGGGHIGRGGLGGDTWDGDPAPSGDLIGRPLGGLGGAGLTYTPVTHLSFGGGGGSGDENNNVGAGGGTGGGVVFVRAGALAGAGIMSANGQQPTFMGGNAQNDATGGGGAGGAVIVLVSGPAACGVNGLRANGGNGGNLVFASQHGTGGGGAGGLVYLRSAAGSTCTGQANAGTAGLWNATPSTNAGPTVGTDMTSIGAVDAMTTAFSGGVCSPGVLGANQCGGCLLSTECPAATPVCNTTSHQCIACDRNFGIPGGNACPSVGAPVCLLSGVGAGTCVECGADGDCAGNINGLICDTTKNTCGTCTASNNVACGTVTATFCNTTPAHNLCAGCNGNSGSGATRACSAALPACVMSGGLSGACVECEANGDCTGNVNGPLCDAGKTTCGVCTAGNATACPVNQSYCDTSGVRDVCAGCDGGFGSGSARACPTAMLSVCAMAGVNAGSCVQCSSNATCSGVTPVCNTATNVCAGCNGNFGSAAPLACFASAPYCDSMTGECKTACVRDADCGAGNWCNDISAAGVCQPLVPNAQGVPGGACTTLIATRACVTGICDARDNLCGLAQGGGTCTSTGQCRAGVCVGSGANVGLCGGCNMDGDCAAPTAACNPATNLCVGCTAMRADLCTGTTPVCGSGNTCLACNGDNGSGATNPCPQSAAPLCTQTGACGTCANNADCAAGTHAGPICNTVSGSCGTGCTVDADCADKWCDNPTAGVAAGVCIPKIPNGQPLPASQPIAGACTAPVGMRVCISGACEDGDDRCGLDNGRACVSAAVCRSNVCFTDGMCGSPNGQACTMAATCRSNICAADGMCGARTGDACTMDANCRTGTCSSQICGGLQDASVGMDAMSINDGGTDALASDAPRSDAAASDAAAPRDGALADASRDAATGVLDGGVAGMAGGGMSGAGGTAGAAGIGGEAGGPPSTVDFSGGGCSCETGGSRTRSGASAALLGLMVMITLRRRRRRG